MRRAWIAALLIPAAYVAARSPLGADYGNLGCHFNSPRCDEPAWPLEALARGDFSTFVHDQPLMGPASMILRAPVVAVAREGRPVRLAAARSAIARTASSRHTSSSSWCC